MAWGLEQRLDAFIKANDSIVDFTIDEIMKSDGQSRSPDSIRDADDLFLSSPFYHLLIIKRYDISSIEMIRHAFVDAYRHHAGQYRKEEYKDTKRKLPFFQHVLWVAAGLVNRNYNAEIIAAGLLHDVLERQNDKDSVNITLGHIKENYNANVAEYVDALSEKKPSKNIPKEEKKKRFLTELLSALLINPEIFAIKAMDRLHNLLSFDVYNDSAKARILDETYDFYLPIAEFMDQTLFKFLELRTKDNAKKLELSRGFRFREFRHSHLLQDQQYHAIVELENMRNYKRDKNKDDDSLDGVAQAIINRNRYMAEMGKRRIERLYRFVTRFPENAREIIQSRNDLEGVFNYAKRKKLERRYADHFLPNHAEYSKDGSKVLARTDVAIRRLLTKVHMLDSLDEQIINHIDMYHTSSVFEDDRLTSFAAKHPYIAEKVRFLFRNRQADMGWGKAMLIGPDEKETGYVSPLRIYNANGERFGYIEAELEELPLSSTEASVGMVSDNIMEKRFSAPALIFTREEYGQGSSQYPIELYKDPWNMTLNIENPSAYFRLYRVHGPDYELGYAGKDDVFHVLVKVSPTMKSLIRHELRSYDLGIEDVKNGLW